MLDIFYSHFQNLHQQKLKSFLYSETKWRDLPPEITVEYLSYISDVLARLLLYFVKMMEFYLFQYEIKFCSIYYFTSSYEAVLSFKGSGVSRNGLVLMGERYGVILYYFTRVVKELVFSSLDAGATKVPSTYPREPPKVKCKTKVYIILILIWRVIYGLYLHFTEPNHEDPLNLEAAVVLGDNPELFKSNVKRAMHGVTVVNISFTQCVV
ncbi:hypothetical protein KY290_015155 [Solanum tuberosum]|uniref:Uncharacterized protein n=1 Tax=Solanum tuberosum TaxID=4113 RepID=A0ABQ7VRU0_SOLTU|nr:hypothetical protein KY284_014509 [Solanum tuberosum]KAH0718516.1 hypothetical protein KY285_014547 [Solanum tuberosum]KAH0771174.1 hypothetical protein KY290_015155 [Solanum tuberosum]